MKKNLLNTQPTQVILDVNDAFGCTTDYYLFLVKSDLSPMAFAHQCSQRFQVDFSYLQDYSFDTTGSDVSVPVFSAVFRSQNNLLLFIVPNKVVTHLSPPEDNFTLSIPMFEDVYYFLGHGGFCRYECPYDNYDFVLQIAVDKDSTIEEALKVMKQHPEWKTKDITSLLSPAEPVATTEGKKRTKNKKSDKQPLDIFLKSCCMEIVRAHDDAENRRMSRFLGPNRHIPEANHVRKVKSIFELLQQEDPNLEQKETLVVESMANQKLITREDV